MLNSRANIGCCLFVTDSRLNVDSFTDYHGPSRGFAYIVFIPGSSSGSVVVPILASLLAVGALVCAWLLAKWHSAVAIAKAIKLSMVQEKLDSHMEDTGNFVFGMVLVNARIFLNHGQLMSFEDLRDNDDLKVSIAPLVATV